MEIVILENSEQISCRLVDLISENNFNIKFHQVHTKAGLELISDCKPDVVLLDLKFACDKSLELLKQFKASNDKVVFIILYSRIDGQTLEKCKKLGVDYVLDKYDDFEKIPGIIRDIQLKNK